MPPCKNYFQDRRGQHVQVKGGNMYNEIEGTTVGHTRKERPQREDGKVYQGDKEKKQRTERERKNDLYTRMAVGAMGIAALALLITTIVVGATAPGRIHANMREYEQAMQMEQRAGVSDFEKRNEKKIRRHERRIERIRMNERMRHERQLARRGAYDNGYYGYGQNYDGWHTDPGYPAIDTYSFRPQFNLIQRYIDKQNELNSENRLRRVMRGQGEFPSNGIRFGEHAEPDTKTDNWNKSGTTESGRGQVRLVLG